MDIKNKSLSELEEIYKERVEHWRKQRAEHLRKAEECAQQIETYDQKLRHIVALVNGPSAAAAIPAPLPPRRSTRKKVKRRRKSPIRDATLQVLRNRPGQKLTVAQIRTAIRKDTHKRCSRQAINVGVDVLEKMGLVKRDRAPKGSGAQFVFWAL